MKRGDDDAGRSRRVGGLFGAAEGAPLTQGRNGSLPLELDGDDLTVPPEAAETERGAPTEPLVHAPTTVRVDPLPVATGEPTVETVEGAPILPEDERRGG